MFHLWVRSLSPCDKVNTGTKPAKMQVSQPVAIVLEDRLFLFGNHFFISFIINSVMNNERITCLDYLKFCWFLLQ